MIRRKLKFLRNKVIEEITELRIREYESLTGRSVEFPVPLENLVESVLGLRFDWDFIEERPGEQILAGLAVQQRKILLNENQLALFEEKPGLERSTIGHEAGHWDLEFDRAANFHPTLPGFEVAPYVVFRQATKSNLLVEVLNRAVHDDRYWRLYQQLTSGNDTPEVKSAVDRYQSSLLMPAWLIREAADRFDFTRWTDLYELAEIARVSISNLVVRLQRLGLLYIPQGQKTLYRNRDAFTGQKTLF